MPRGPEHQGWTNYETYLIAVWLDNDEPLYRERQRKVKAAVRANETIEEDDTETFDRDAAIADLARDLKTWVEEMAEEEGPTGSVWADLINSALAEVDWHDLAQSWIDE